MALDSSYPGPECVRCGSSGACCSSGPAGRGLGGTQARVCPPPAQLHMHRTALTLTCDLVSTGDGACCHRHRHQKDIVPRVQKVCLERATFVESAVTWNLIVLEDILVLNFHVMTPLRSVSTLCTSDLALLHYLQRCQKRRRQSQIQGRQRARSQAPTRGLTCTFTQETRPGRNRCFMGLN